MEVQELIRVFPDYETLTVYLYLYLHSRVLHIENVMSSNTFALNYNLNRLAVLCGFLLDNILT